VDKELIQIPQDDVFTALQDIKRARYEAALTNLVTGKTPKDVVFERPIRGGSNVDYVPGWWFVEQLNSLFGHLWDFRVLRESVGTVQVWVLGELTVRSYEGAVVVKTAYGGSDIKKYSDKTEKSGQVIDIADDLKAAATDSLKKASTLLGLASDIYGKREVTERTGPGKSQIAALYKIGLSKGMDKEKVDTYCTQKHGKLPNEIETVLVLGLIQELRSK